MKLSPMVARTRNRVSAYSDISVYLPQGGAR